MSSLVDRLETFTLRRYGSVFNGGRVGSIFCLMNICVIKKQITLLVSSNMAKNVYCF